MFMYDLYSSVRQCLDASSVLVPACVDASSKVVPAINSDLPSHRHVLLFLLENEKSGGTTIFAGTRLPIRPPPAPVPPDTAVVSP